MKTRLITAGVSAALAIAIIIFGSFYSIIVTIALSLVSVILCGEFLSAKKLNKDIRIFIPCLLFAFLIPMLSMTEARFIPMFVFVFGIWILAIVFHRSLRMEDIFFSCFGVVLITISLSALNILVSDDPQHAAFWILICLAIPWFADSAAYFAGSYFGNHKLCPGISPHKTVEGAVAGVIAGTLSALLIGGIFKLIYGDVTVYYGVLLMIGFLNSVVSIFGDLAFSIIKRSCKIKDFGSIMPGHGGLLDRFDSVLFCIPLVYIFSQFFYFCV